MNIQDLTPSAIELEGETVFNLLERNEDEGKTNIETQKNGGVGTVMLIFMAYVATFGAGPYAMEKLIATGYPLIAILGLLILPWVTGLQCALMTAELSTSIKHNGGFMVWVKEAFGEYWSFQVAAYAMMSSIIDLAIYPVLFCEYINQFYELDTFYKSLIRLGFVLICMMLSIFGAKCIGRASIFLTLLAISPFVVMVLWGIKDVDPTTWIILPPKPFLEIKWGLLIGLLAWCTQGFDSLSQMAEDITDPKKYKFSMIFTLILIIVSSLLPLIVAVGIDKHYDKYEEGYFATIGFELGGEFMKIWVVLGACIGTLATFNLYLYTTSVLFGVWAGDEFIGISIFSVKSAWSTPWVSIILIAVLTYSLTFFDFSVLVQIDQAFYQMTLLLKYAALIQLRRTRPEMERPYKIGFEIKGLIAFVIPPIIVAIFIIIATTSSSLFNITFVGGVTLLSLVMPFIIAIIKKLANRQPNAVPKGCETTTVWLSDKLFNDKKPEYVKDDLEDSQNEEESKQTSDEKTKSEELSL